MGGEAVMNRTLRYTLNLLIGIALLAAGALGLLALLTRPSLPGEPMAQPLPDVTLLDASGAPVSLAELRGRPLLLNVWATWCPPCDGEMPALEALHQQQGGAGAQVVAVNLQEASPVVAAYLAEKGLTLPVLLDGAGELAAQLDVTYLPTTFFVDEARIIRSRVRRALTLEEMQTALMALQQAAERRGSEGWTRMNTDEHGSEKRVSSSDLCLSALIRVQNQRGDRTRMNTDQKRGYRAPICVYLR